MAGLEVEGAPPPLRESFAMSGAAAGAAGSGDAAAVAVPADPAVPAKASPIEPLAVVPGMLDSQSSVLPPPSSSSSSSSSDPLSPSRRHVRIVHDPDAPPGSGLEGSSVLVVDPSSGKAHALPGNDDNTASPEETGPAQAWGAFEFLGWADEAGSPTGHAATSPSRRHDAYSPTLLRTTERQRNWNRHRHQTQRQSQTLNSGRHQPSQRRGADRHQTHPQRQPHGQSAQSLHRPRNHARPAPQLNYATFHFHGDATRLRTGQQAQPKRVLQFKTAPSREAPAASSSSRAASLSSLSSPSNNTNNNNDNHHHQDSSRDAPLDPQRVGLQRQVAYLKQRSRVHHSLRGRRSSKDGKLKPMREKSWKKNGLTVSSLAVRRAKSSHQVRRGTREQQRRKQYDIEHGRLPIQQLQQNKLPHISRAALDEIMWGVKDPYAPLAEQLETLQLQGVEQRPFTTASASSLLGQSCQHVRDHSNTWRASRMPNEWVEDEIRGIPTRAASPIRVSRALQRGNRHASSRSLGLKGLPKALPLPGSKQRKRMTRMGMARSLGSRSTMHHKKRRDGQQVLGQHGELELGVGGLGRGVQGSLVAVAI
jgi:hypothetical protein